MNSDRRNFFHMMGAGAAGLAIATRTTPAIAADLEDDGPELLVGEGIAVTDTRYGKVRGYKLRGINYFLGIPYGADTSGTNRFMPPRSPEAWSDVFPALWWGNSAPQDMENRYANPIVAFRDHWNYYDVDENCLRINVFTPGIGDGKKRPVLVWLHGGGFTNGNAIEQDGYNGENLARSGDVVFCSVNHRLGPLGFCNLAGTGDDDLATSGNVGMLDIVAALEWVRDNIENFGGNPDNVTIMGQSGGGAKVTTLTAMPSAEGLFHKAVVLSGASLRMGEKQESEKLGAYVLEEAGLTSSQWKKMQEFPWKTYYAFATKALARLREERGGRRGLRGGFNPVVDGEVLPQHPYFPVPAPTATNIPMLICSTFHEISPGFSTPGSDDITLDEVAAQVIDRAGFSSGFGDRAGAVVNAYANAFPDKKPVEIWALVSSTRQSTVALADAKSQQSAPVYVAWFGWQPPLFDGRMGAFHCIDICFWFHNTDLMLSHTGGGARPRELAKKMAGSLLGFMKNGDPNGGGLPDWPTYTSANGETMVLNDISEVRNDPDRQARRFLPAL